MERIEFIQEALNSEGLSFPPGMIDRFDAYRKLLLNWNQKVNLVSRKDEDRIVTRHFLESLGYLTVSTFPPDSRVMDLGSGAGFPGIPMKLLRPDLRVCLVESKRKKILFLRRVIESLALEGIEAVLGRVEELGEDLGVFDFIVSRSVTDLATLVEWSNNYLQPIGGCLITVKGQGVQEDLERLESIAPNLGVERVRLGEFKPFPKILHSKKSIVVTVQWTRA